MFHADRTRKARELLAEKGKEKDRLLKGNIWLENPKLILGISISGGVVLLLLANFLLNVLIRICQGHLSDCVSWSCLTTFHPWLWPLYLFGVVIGGVSAGLNVYRFRNAFRDINAGQKGTSRFATMEEIKAQYPAVPERPEVDADGRTVRIPGNGGLPVACMDGKMYLDETATNTLIMAITRAGKGELFSIRMLDSYSRSALQPSLVILDMKFDLRKMCTKTFQDRGYKVMSINLEEPLRGIGYNPLYLITRYYQEGKPSDAELLCKAFAYPHFVSSGRSDDNSDFFLSNASSALAAVIMAHTMDCLKQDIRENARRAEQYIRKRTAYERLSAGERTQADEAYAEAAEWPFQERVDRLDYLPDIPFEKTRENAAKNNMPSVLHLFTSLAGEYVDRNTTRLDEYFDMRGSYDRAKAVYSSIHVSGDRTKGSIFSQMLTKLSQYTFGGIEQLTRESTFSPEELGFGEQPIALFLQVPFYDRSKDAIAISFIDQIYQANARACVQSRGGKCERRIIFHLDEIAQFPPIESLESKLSLCLGLNMVFNLIIQTDAQLTQKYGEAAKIIRGNCGNQVYLQTSEEETAKQFSSLLGNRTIVNVNRIGGRLSLNKSYTETTEDRALLQPRELMDLQEGENVIVRTMYRRDLQGNKIKPRPIYNREEEGRAFLYRYQYLTDFFPDADTVSEADLNLPTLKTVRPEDMIYDYAISFEAAEYRELLRWYRKEGTHGPKPEEGEAVTPEMENEIAAWMQNMERYHELEQKGLYQWDEAVPMTEETCRLTVQKQFLRFCGELDQTYGTGLLGRQEISKGELLLAVMKEEIPLNRKRDMLAYLQR